MARELVITIDQHTGQVTYESRGYPGRTCHVPAQAARELLGTPTAERDTAGARLSPRQVQVNRPGSR